MAESIETLKALTLDELEARYNAAARETPIGVDFYRKEIEWRRQTEQAEKIEIMTFNIENMAASVDDTARRLLLMTRALLAATVFVGFLQLAQMLGR